MTLQAWRSLAWSARSISPEWGGASMRMLPIFVLVWGCRSFDYQSFCGFALHTPAGSSYDLFTKCKFGLSIYVMIRRLTTSRNNETMWPLNTSAPTSNLPPELPGSPRGSVIQGCKAENAIKVESDNQMRRTPTGERPILRVSGNPPDVRCRSHPRREDQNHSSHGKIRETV